jgi:hypothetical protein
MIDPTIHERVLLLPQINDACLASFFFFFFFFFVFFFFYVRFGVLRRNTVHLPACGRESGLASAPRPWIGIGSSSKRQACDWPCPCLISSSVEYPHKSQYNLAEILSPSCHMLSFFLSFFLLEPEDQRSRCYSCSIIVFPLLSQAQSHACPSRNVERA